MKGKSQCRERMQSGWSQEEGMQYKRMQEERRMYEAVPHPSPDRHSENRISPTQLPSTRQSKPFHAFLSQLRSETQTYCLQTHHQFESNLSEDQSKDTSLRMMRRRINELEEENSEYKMRLWDYEQVSDENQSLRERVLTLESNMQSHLKQSNHTYCSPHILISTPSASSEEWQDLQTQLKNTDQTNQSPQILISDLKDFRLIEEQTPPQGQLSSLKREMSDLESKLMDNIGQLYEKINHIQNVFMQQQASNVKEVIEYSPQFGRRKSSIFELQSGSEETIKLKSILSSLEMGERLLKKYSEEAVLGKSSKPKGNETTLCQIGNVISRLEKSYNHALQQSNLTVRKEFQGLQQGQKDEISSLKVYEGPQGWQQTDEIRKYMTEEWRDQPTAQFWALCQESSIKLTIILQIISELNEQYRQR